jgi:hypothetical protein
MEPTVDTVHLTLRVVAENVSDEEIAHLTYQLIDEMRELDIESVESLREKQSPQGAKAADPVTLGAMAVAVLPVVVPKLVEFLRDWSLRGANRTVKIETQIGNRSVKVEIPQSMSAEELKKLVDMLTGAMEKKAR